jgi:hypothetical protein
VRPLCGPLAAVDQAWVHIFFSDLSARAFHFIKFFARQREWQGRKTHNARRQRSHTER